MIHKEFRTQCNQEGYRRGSVAHSAVWKVWAADYFTQSQYESIIGDRKIRHDFPVVVPAAPADTQFEIPVRKRKKDK